MHWCLLIRNICRSSRGGVANILYNYQHTLNSAHFKCIVHSLMLVPATLLNVLLLLHPICPTLLLILALICWCFTEIRKYTSSAAAFVQLFRWAHTHTACVRMCVYVCNECPAVFSSVKGLQTVMRSNESHQFVQCKKNFDPLWCFRTGGSSSVCVFAACGNYRLFNCK